MTLAEKLDTPKQLAPVGEPYISQLKAAHFKRLFAQSQMEHKERDLIKARGDHQQATTELNELLSYVAKDRGIDPQRAIIDFNTGAISEVEANQTSPVTGA